MNKPALTERTNPNTLGIDLMDGEEIARMINNEDKKVALAVEKVIPQIGEAVEVIAQGFKNGGRLAYFGAGTSGRIGVLDASECWPTFGVEHGMVNGYIAGGDKALRFSVENAEDSEEAGIEDLRDFNPKVNDVIVGISANGGAKYVLAVLREAQKSGAKTIALTSNPEAEIKKFADIVINPIVGEEVITGSSRMKSGTAQKMVLNMLSTGAMIRIGKTYKNYMIDVRMMNEKLVERGVRFVREIAQVSETEARKYIEASDYNVKEACVMAVKKCDKQQATQMLAQVGGILRKIIQD